MKHWSPWLALAVLDTGEPPHRRRIAQHAAGALLWLRRRIPRRWRSKPLLRRLTMKSIRFQTCVLVAACICLQSLAAAQSEVQMKPRFESPGSGHFVPRSEPALVVGRSLDAQRNAVCAPIQAWLQAAFGSVPQVRPFERAMPSVPSVVILTQKDADLSWLNAEGGLKNLPALKLPPEGFILSVTPFNAFVIGGTAAGAYYGALGLASLASGGARSLPVEMIEDWPTMAWRGIHVTVNSRAELPDIRTLITSIMPELRLNKVILQVDYHFQFKSHPECAEADSLTLQDCRELTELARSHFVEIIPMIDCLGHQSWADHTAKLLTAHPEFDETPNIPPDNKGIYCRSWCPSNPAVDKVVFDLIDELVNAFHARAFHVGMDEVFILGECPRCKGTPNAVLFAREVNHLHQHIVGKLKLQMMMWADRLEDGKSTGYGEWEASENETYPSIDMIPKDIVLCDWHYETEYNGQPAAYPSVKYLQDRGFRVWPSGWKTVDNVQMLTAASMDHPTDRMVGYLATTWIGVSPLVQDLTTGGGMGEAASVAGAVRAGAQIAWTGTEAVTP